MYTMYTLVKVSYSKQIILNKGNNEQMSIVFQK